MKPSRAKTGVSDCCSHANRGSVDWVARAVYNHSMSATRGRPPFCEYMVYGPILHKKEGRRIIVLVPVDREHGPKRTSTSYARYLMSVDLGRPLLPSEHVDHIDENKLNDSLSNLQLLSIGENNSKYRAAKGIKKAIAILACPACGIVFERPKNQTHLVKGGAFSACSRKCSGTFVGMIQHGDRQEAKKRLAQNLVRIEFRLRAP